MSNDDRLILAMKRLQSQIEDVQRKFDPKTILAGGGGVGPLELLGVIIANQLALMTAMYDFLATMVVETAGPVPPSMRN